MKQLNLLPYAARKKAAQQRLLPFVAVAALLGLAAAATLWFGMGLQVKRVSAEANQLEQGLQKERQSVGSSKDAAAIKQTVTRISQLNTLSQREVSWAKVFAAVQGVIPPDTQLTSASHVAADGTVSIRLTGVSPSNLSFAGFVESLRRNASLTEVKVESYTFDATKGTVTFGIGAKLSPSAALYVAPSAKPAK